MAAAVFSFYKSWILGHCNPYMANICLYQLNLMRMFSSATEKWLKIQIQNGGRGHPEFLPKVEY